MGKLQLIATTLVLGLATAAAEAGPPVRIGIGLNFGGPYYYRGYGYPYYYGGYPYPYPYVVPGPVVYQNPPVIVQQGPVVGTTPAYSAPAPSVSGPEPERITTANAVTPANPNAQSSLEYHLSRLSNPDEGLRRESVMELGRTKSDRAVDPLTATLAGDRSPAVRDAAARALGAVRRRYHPLQPATQLTM